jgi:hypothetical protein
MENPDLKNTSDEDLLKIIALYLNSGIYRISNNRENVLEVLEKFRSALSLLRCRTVLLMKTCACAAIPTMKFLIVTMLTNGRKK